MTDPNGPDTTVFLSYTHALRHPVIIGKVAGWSLPWAMSATQLGTIAVTATALLMARPVWAHLGGIGNVTVFTVVVAGSGWAVRHWRIEGRSPLRVAASMATLWTSPAARFGVRNGTPAVPPRPRRSHTPPVAMVDARYNPEGGHGG